MTDPREPGQGAARDARDVQPSAAAPPAFPPPSSAPPPYETRAQQGHASRATGPVDVSTAELAAAAGIAWNPPPLPTTGGAGWHPTSAAPRRPVAGAALTVAIISLAGSLFFGWVLPLAVVSAVLAAVALSRRWERRAVAGWALALAILAVLYCCGWIAWTLFAVGVLR